MEAQAPGDGVLPRERLSWFCQDFHEQLAREARAASKEASPEVLFVGDSILETLRGTAAGRPLKGTKCKGAAVQREECIRLERYKRRCSSSWEPGWESAESVLDAVQVELGSRPLILARGGDATQHIMWRLQNGELPASLQPKAIFILAGINNLIKGGGEDDAKSGIAALVKHLRAMRPDALLVIHTLLPDRDGTRKRLRSNLDGVNAFIRDLENHHPDVKVIDCSDKLRRKGSAGAMDPSFMMDELHPNRRGHEVWAHCYAPQLASMLAERRGRRSRSQPQEAEATAEPQHPAQ